MLHLVLFSLLAFVFVDTAKEYLLCNSSNLEVRYSLHDENNHPNFYMHPCVIDTKTEINFSMSWIPRIDLHVIYLTVDTWLQSAKVFEYKYEICSGTDHEFPFCGALKGETITISIVKVPRHVPYFTGSLIAKLLIFAGEQKELAVGCNVTFFVKKYIL
ncbi:lymphocyte antigen 96 [Bombina bombina]|uniref:lymphocyte antigen 96 n=1 Tax=Bombina bombina TaxID=8345 RepID=UPI00235B19C4|nr:lymphocyte antigen 96 [Bombina bombina]